MVAVDSNLEESYGPGSEGNPKEGAGFEPRRANHWDWGVIIVIIC